MRYKIIIEYKGTSFIGWQKQADNPNSVCAIIEKAIFDLTGQKVNLVASGRTDAGVHALAQVAHFDLERADDISFRMKAGLNHYLRGVDIAILNVELVDETFHSRFSAHLRHYQYQIICRREHLTLYKNLAWQIKYPLDLEEMIEASKYLLGKHDFSSFRDSQCQAKNAIRSIEKIEIFKEVFNEIEFIKLNFSARSFLHHQVRNMVGTLVLAGRNKIKAEDVKTILEQKDRTKSGSNAPAYGLYFTKVDF